MPRKKLIRSTEFPYHVTARSNNREPFANDLYETWKIMGEHLSEISTVFEVKIHAFVLMPNHFHLLLSTPTQDLGIVMQSFMCSITKTMNLKIGRTGRVFGARYHWSLITTSHYFDCALKYVYRNPVKAEITERAEEYYFSTLRILNQDSVRAFPIHPVADSETLFPQGQKESFIGWKKTSSVLDGFMR